MSTRGIVMLLLTCVSTVTGNLMLRTGLLKAGGISLSSGRIVGQLLALTRQPLFVIGFVLYAVATLIWFAVISSEDLSTAYPILASLTFALVTTGAILFFHERITAQKLTGIAIILLGVIVVARA
jgi:multidrug transporter EmrE-like cation transporter